MSNEKQMCNLYYMNGASPCNVLYNFCITTVHLLKATYCMYIQKIVLSKGTGRENCEFRLSGQTYIVNKMTARIL